MDQMIGDWSMVRGNGQTICGLTLTNTEAHGDNFQVFLKPKCDPGGCGLRAERSGGSIAARCILMSAKRPDLAVRGRRQRAVAAGAGYGRSPDHAARAVALSGRPGSPRPAKIILKDACRSGRRPFVVSIARQFRGDRPPRLASTGVSPCASCLSLPRPSPTEARRRP